MNIKVKIYLVKLYSMKKCTKSECKGITSQHDFKWASAVSGSELLTKQENVNKRQPVIMRLAMWWYWLWEYTVHSQTWQVYSWRSRVKLSTRADMVMGEWSCLWVNCVPLQSIWSHCKPHYYRGSDLLTKQVDKVKQNFQLVRYGKGSDFVVNMGSIKATWETAM